MPWATAIIRGTVPHRFLLVELELEDDKMWLKLERKPQSKISLLRGFGRTTAKDEVWRCRSRVLVMKYADAPLLKGQFFKHNRDILIKFQKGYCQENEYRLDSPYLTLRDLSFIIDVICRLHPRYTLILVRYFSHAIQEKTEAEQVCCILLKCKM